MSEEKKLKKKQDIESKISLFNLIGLAILAFCYLGALYNVYKIKSDFLIDGKKTIRIAHWQLELGIRDAISEIAKEFEANNPDVKIIQIPITERAYAQWVTTQLIGRTSPDLIELGFFNVVDYCGRYFLPLGTELRKPNPFNKDNPELKNLAWIDTFRDGLSGTYITELLDYYGVGFSRFTIRMFYNKDIFKKVTGKDDPPATLQELFSICEKIQKYSKQKNQEIEKFNANLESEKGGLSRYIPFMKHRKKSRFILEPIASSRYQVNLLRPRYSSMLSALRTLEFDYNMDGFTSFDEFTRALIRGELTYDDPTTLASLNLMKDFSNYFTPGFMSIDRMDSGFAFVQGKAAMITSGSWDASSFIKKIKDQPVGDIILEINGVKTNNSASVAEEISKAAMDGKKIDIIFERDGYKRNTKITPKKYPKIWDSIGIELADISDDNSPPRPIIVEIDDLSPAYYAGLKKRMRFEVGIFDFPTPKDHPVYGKYFVGPVKEKVETAFSFGIAKFSKNIPEAIKFLQFATTPQNNEKLNNRAQWIPAVKGAKPIKMLEPFEPNEEGYWGWLSYNLSGGRTSMIENQLYWPFISGEITTEQYLQKLNEQLPSAAAVDYENYITGFIEKTPDKNYLRSVWLAKFAFAKNDEELKNASNKLPAAWENYLIFKNNFPKHLISMEPLLKNRPENNFSKEFFKTYDTLSIKDKK